MHWNKRYLSPFTNGEVATKINSYPFMSDKILNFLHFPKIHMFNNRTFSIVASISAAFILLAIVIIGIFVTNDANQTDFLQKNLSPSLQHPFGTDWMGRDMFLRTLAGLSLSIVIGLLASLISSFIALVLATFAALGGKWADSIVSWLVDVMMGIPHIVLVVLISFALGEGFVGVVFGVAFTHWPSLTRVLRAEILQCRESGFVATAQHLGVSPIKIMTKHMIPYILPQFFVGMILMFPHAILHEAAVTFLGFGLPPEQPAIGIILSESMSYLSAGMWWLAVFPGISLVLVIMLFDLVGSSLRKMVDPYRSQE